MMKIRNMKMKINIRKSLGISLKCSVIKNIMAKKMAMVSITAIKVATKEATKVVKVTHIRVKRCFCGRCYIT